MTGRVPPDVAPPLVEPGCEPGAVLLALRCGAVLLDVVLLGAVLLGAVPLVTVLEGATLEPPLLAAPLEVARGGVDDVGAPLALAGATEAEVLPASGGDETPQAASANVAAHATAVHALALTRVTGQR